MSASVSSRQDHPVLPRLTPLAAAIRALLMGGMASGAAPVAQAVDLSQSAVALPALSEPLPVPADAGLVAPGNGEVERPTVDGKRMTVHQLSTKAVLDWKRFNIAKEHSVEFKQPDATSVALNRIQDGNPSQILGSLSANGQLYLINQNGFLFGKDARVNTNSLTVSTLPIKQDVFNKDLTRVFDQDGSAAIGDESAPGYGEVYRKDAQGNRITDPQGHPLKREVRIEEGAKLQSQDGGRIMIFAPSITNKGEIETPGGQTIVAAATDKVYLQQADSSTTGVRGLLVEVATGGDVNNLGRIAAKQGSVTLAGFAVNQDGRVSASTSVNLNGSIRLLAREGGGPDPKVTDKKVLVATKTDRSDDNNDGLGKTAKVVLGQGSVTEVLPDTDSGTTALDDQEQPKSRVEMVGKRIELRESSQVVAPGGEVSVRATTRLDKEVDDTPDPDARVELRFGSRIDVSGVKDVSVPMSRNVVAVELRSFELRDAPLQRPKDINNYDKKEFPLYAQTIYVDSRTAKDGRIPLADISGATARTERTAAERSTTGGQIKLNSSGTVDIERGATLDVSGGSVRYSGGRVQTTLLGANGRQYEVSKADPGLHFDSVRRGPGRFERGYVEGKDAGGIAIRTDKLRLDGDVVGTVQAGRYQRRVNQRPLGSTLDIDLALQNLAASQNSLDTISRQPIALVSATAPIEEQVKRLFPGLSDDSLSPLVLVDRVLLRAGLRNLKLTTNTGIGVAEGTRLNLDSGGSVELNGGEVDFRGRINAPSGTVNLRTTVSAGSVSAPVDLGIDGTLTFAKGARIDVSGRWSNDLLDKPSPRNNLGSVQVDGGTVTLTAEGKLDFQKGSRIGADGGAWLQADGKIQAGKGGEIDLEARYNPVFRDATDNNLILDGRVHAYGLKEGGALSLTSNQVLVGDAFSAIKPLRDDLLPLVLAPNMLNSGGFRDYRLDANRGDVRIGNDAVVRLTSKNFVLDADYQTAPSGGSLGKMSRIETLDPTLRQAVNLNLDTRAITNTDGDYNPDGSVILEAGSKVLADPKSQVSLLARHQIQLGGTVNTPAGSLDTHIDNSSPFARYRPDQGVYVGREARLLGRGVVLPNPTGPIGRRDDEVLPGGTINLNAERGYLVLEKGSLVDVSGAETIVDEVRQNSGPGGTPVVHASSAGSIKLGSAEGIFPEGRLVGHANKAAGAEGGLLSLAVDRVPTNLQASAFNGASASFPTAPRTVEIKQQTDFALPEQWQFATALDDSLNGTAHLSVQQFRAGGFESLSLRTGDVVDTGTFSPQQIRFAGDVNLQVGRSIELNSPTIVVEPLEGTADAGVTLNTAYLRMGSSDLGVRDLLSGGLPAPTEKGTGRFTAISRDIELIGGLRLQGTAKTSLLSDRDLRLRGLLPTANPAVGRASFDGELQTLGDLTLKADQIYPATLSQYSIKVLGDDNGRLEILGGDRTGPVLSAGGGISAEAPNIFVTGALKAPFGTIDLKATASELTLARGATVSVSGEGQTIPFGTIQAQLNWLYPASETAPTVTYPIGGGTDEVAPPTGSVSLSAPRVTLQDGATVDVSGSGDLYARELVPGRGGSADPLDPADPRWADAKLEFAEKYAVLPWLGDRVAPFDPIESPKYDLKPGDSILLAESAAGLPAGRYTLLPASYALLPGAYLVTPQADITGIFPGETARTLDGTPVVAGQRTVAGTGSRDFRWQGFSVESGKQFRRRTEYFEATGNSFFTAQAERIDRPVPNLPRDAGNLTLNATRTLDLSGRVNTQAGKDGVAGRVSVTADAVRIVADAKAAPSGSGELAVSAPQLSQLNAGSLLIGATEQRDGETRNIQVQSTSVSVDPGVSLTSPELILAANDRVTVGDGANLRGEGQGAVSGSKLKISGSDSFAGDSALLRVSAAGQTEIERAVVGGGRSGSLDVGQDAVVGAIGSVSLDTTGPSRFAGRFDLQPGQSGTFTSASVTANRLNLGDATAATAGLTLTAGQLAGYAGDELNLTSRGPLTTFGSVAVTAGKHLALQAQSVAADPSGTVTASFQAPTVTLSNPGAAGEAVAAGTGTLTINASDVLEFSGGDFGLSGFAAGNLAGASAFQVSGQGRLATAGDLTLVAANFTAESGGRISFEAPGHGIAFQSAAAGATAPVAGLGSVYTVDAASVILNSAFQLPSGRLDVKADQAIALGAGAQINLAGMTSSFAGKDLATPGGDAALLSRSGNISLAGSSIDISGRDEAGSLSVSAPLGTVVWNGTLTGTAANKGAALTVQAGSLDPAGVTAILGQWQSLGRASAFDLRVGSGDLSIAEGFSGAAETIRLAADQGALTIAGTLDASGARAGKIDLAAGDAVKIRGTARLLAGTTTENGAGGSILAESVDRDGDGVSGIAVENGAQLDVRGGLLNNPEALKEGDQLRYVVDGPTVDDPADGKTYRAGDIHFRALRDPASDGSKALPITVGAAKLTGTPEVVAEAVRVYADDSITREDIDQWQADTRAYMDGLNPASFPGLTVQPGLEIRSTGDLTLTTPWTFATGPNVPAPAWRYGSNSAPGFLTLRAGGNLRLDANLSDGVAGGWLNADGSIGTSESDPSFVREMIMPGNSWSFRLVAGADAVGAHGAQTVSGTGNINLAKGTQVRTGTGDLQLNAGADIALADDTAAIYTLGRVLTDPADRFGSFGQEGAANYWPVDYPVEGGNIRISAGGNIRGAVSEQFVPDWLFRTGQWGITDPSTGESNKTPVAWGLSLSQPTSASGFIHDPTLSGFRQNVGALAGGNVTINAGGDITNLNAMLPTVGKPRSELLTTGSTADTATVKFNQIDVHGGGRLEVEAGGDIRGGSFYAEHGSADVNAGGSVGEGAPFVRTTIDGTTKAVVDRAEFQLSGPVIYQGDADITISARSDTTIGTVLNPFLLPKRASGRDGLSETVGLSNAFSTYGPGTSLQVKSFGGAIRFETNSKAVGDAASIDFSQAEKALSTYPARLAAYAFAGSIDLARPFRLAPSSQGNLELLSDDSILIGSEQSRTTILVSDADPNVVPSPMQPSDGKYDQLPFFNNRVRDEKLDTANREFDGDINRNYLNYLPSGPLHESDTNPVLIAARRGDLSVDEKNLNTPSGFILPKRAVVEVGNDLRNVNFDIQNVNPTDITRFSVGRDLVFQAPRDSNGTFINQTESRFQISGPGDLMILAGRNADLGSHDGIVTAGNQFNPALPATGANVTVLAGLRPETATSTATQTTAGTAAATASETAGNLFGSLKLDGFLAAYKDRLPELDPQTLGDMTPEDKLRKALPVLFDVIREASAKAAVSRRTKDYQPGYEAINAFFGIEKKDGQEVNPFKGDISMFFSRIHTQAGGDIRLLAPGGSVNAGASSSNFISKKSDKLGIQVLQQGVIESVVDRNFNVNESRVFTLGGHTAEEDRLTGKNACGPAQRCSGDIVVWSSNGDVDAGRGAKGALSVPPPIPGFDANGNPTLTFPPLVSGSGIRTATNDPRRKAGNAYLAAPRGVVDAGEAGIASRNTFIAASAVLGGNNITSTGSTVGVPAAPSVPVVPSGAGNAAAAASQQADQTASQLAGNKNLAKDAARQAAAALTPIQVDVVGFGNCSLGDIREGKPGCGT